MRITVNGRLNKGVTSKDVIMYLISQISTGGATGYFVERYAGPVIKDLSMEGRMTICNMSIEMGARGGLIAPDETTFKYLKDLPSFPGNIDWNTLMLNWKEMKSDKDAEFDLDLGFNGGNVQTDDHFRDKPGNGNSNRWYNPCHR